VKHETQCDGKPVAKGSRSWKTYYVVQQGCLLWFYQHPGNIALCGPMLLFLCASTLVENDYTKRDQVLRVRTRNDGEYLFQVVFGSLTPLCFAQHVFCIMQPQDPQYFSVVRDCFDQQLAAIMDTPHTSTTPLEPRDRLDALQRTAGTSTRPCGFVNSSNLI
jgi:hypothetical protein